MTASELEKFALSIGEKKFRGRQLFEWLYLKQAPNFDAMTSIPGDLRKRLASVATVDSLQLVDSQTSRDDSTTKLLFQLPDGNRIESVLIPPRTAFHDTKASGEEEQQRLTLCISTQVGCPLDCKFCATATMGFLRNLTSGEIIDQVIQARMVAGKRITNLVYMGMGEPLLNYEEVMKSVEILTTGMEIAARHITISTAGWAPRIRQLADENRKVKLAISLHTLDEHARQELMPITKKFSLETLLDAATYYYKKTKRRITFEYILFDGWNDREEDIRRIMKLAGRIPCKLNIIPFHSIAVTGPTGIAATLKPTPPGRIEAFAQRLREKHVTVFVRSSAGEDIDAACGQLAVKNLRGRSRRPAQSHLLTQERSLEHA